MNRVAGSLHVRAVLILLALLAGLAASATAPAGIPPASAAGEPPNIIYIFTDDQPWFSLCGLPDAPPDLCAEPVENHPMPTVEARLMDEGTVFTSAFITDPLCCPSRASFLSGGFYSHHTNITGNSRPNGGAVRFSDMTTLPTVLQQNGYRTAIIGKYVNGYQELVDRGSGTAYVPPGWDEFIVSGVISDLNSRYEFIYGSSTFDQSSTGTIQVVDDGTYLTDYEAARVLDFIEQTCPTQPCDAPFFLYWSVHMPHSPATPAPRHANLFPDFVYRGRGWGEMPDGDLSDKPAHVAQKARSYDVAFNDAFHRNQLRTLRAVDEGIAALLADLETRGILDNTVIIYASDNGMMWGAHNLAGKDWPYEESIRTPLIIRWPAVGSQTIDRLVAADLDLPPTIFELAGVAPIAGDGASLVPLMQDPLAPWRDELLIQGAFQSNVPTWAGIRTADGWKFVEYTTGERELYDLAAGQDPFELNSRHADPAYEDIMVDLAARLDALGRGLAITTDALPDATQGEPYTANLAAWGGNGIYTWSLHNEDRVCEGSLPGGLLVEPDGTITGTPTSSGSWSFCIIVEDSSLSPQPGNDRPQTHIKTFVIDVLPYVAVGTLAGTVTDSASGDPITGATVSVNGMAATTDSAGSYSLAGIPVGTYDVTASGPGYLPATASGVAIVAGTTTTQDFMLDPATSCASNCLQSARITFQVRPQGVSGRVLVLDENGARVAGATVQAVWTLPDQTLVEETATTASNGTARFTAVDGNGTYVLTVVNVTKSGYTFDPENSVLSQSVVK